MIVSTTKNPARKVGAGDTVAEQLQALIAPRSAWILTSTHKGWRSGQPPISLEITAARNPCYTGRRSWCPRLNLQDG